MSQQCCTQSHYGKLDILNFEFDTFPQQLDATAVLQSTVLPAGLEVPLSLKRWVSKDPY